MNARSMKACKEDAIATVDEVAQALAALTSSEIARLNLLAKIRARYAPGLDWRDLLHDAIDKALDGTRKWPRDIPILAFLREAMRSLASEHRRKWSQGPLMTEADLPTNSDGVTLFVSAPSDEPGADREVEARELVDRIRLLFSGDMAVLAILDGMYLGLEPVEIQDRAGLTATHYASAQRRIRRGLARAFPEGVDS